MATVRRRRPTKRGNSKFKPITAQEACDLLHLSDRHFRRIRHHLEIKRLGRKLLVNEYSVQRYLKELPDADG